MLAALALAVACAAPPATTTPPAPPSTTTTTTTTTATTTTKTPAERGADLLARAQAAERELEYPQAQTLLVELFSTHGVSDDVLIEGHLLAGTLERVLENDTEARLHFLYVLRRQPSYALPEDSPPKVRQFFELVREDVKADQKPEPLPSPSPSPPPSSSSSPSLLGPVVAGVGSAVAIAGLASAIFGESTFAAASKPFAERETGRSVALLGWTGTAVGVGVGVAGAVLWLSE